jgi:hypothetical protein
MVIMDVLILKRLSGLEAKRDRAKLSKTWRRNTSRRVAE